MKRITYFLLLALLIAACKQTERSADEIDVSTLYLPNLHLLYPEYEALESTKAYAKLAHKLVMENRDLKSPQMYVEAASLYDKISHLDSIAEILHLAVDRGMANPLILQKFSFTANPPQTARWISLQERLDSIQTELKDVSHFSIEMDAMTEFWPYFERARKDTAKAKDIFKEFIEYQ